MASPTKTSVLGQFSSLSPRPPPSKAIILFLLSSCRLWVTKIIPWELFFRSFRWILQPQNLRESGFLKRALAQTCFRAWYQVRFLRRIFGHSWGLVYGEGGAPGTVPLRNLRVTSHILHQKVPLGWYRVRLFELFLGILRALPLVRYLCKTQKSLHGRHVWETLREFQRKDFFRGTAREIRNFWYHYFRIVLRTY